ncbi:hypothetical protein R7Z42_20515 [Vibrio sp. 1863]|uniref:hypothetical protein n=1 Tax=Vibrio sp. 1863 TaxID=3074579 RepID=UPI002964302C|nr:hypothetical protein [Vibrio sp. 1863]MDW2077400.1 hypothetical protein [Vibrio sp. 1863]
MRKFTERFELAPEYPTGIKYKYDVMGSGREAGEMAGYYCKHSDSYRVMIRGVRYNTSEIIEILKGAQNG